VDADHWLPGVALETERLGLAFRGAWHPCLCRVYSSESTVKGWCRTACCSGLGQPTSLPIPGGSSHTERSFILSHALCSSRWPLCCPRASGAPRCSQGGSASRAGGTEELARLWQAAAGPQPLPPCGVGAGSGQRDGVEARRQVGQGEHRSAAERGGCSRLTAGPCEVRCFGAGVFHGAIRESAGSWLLTRGN